MSYTKVFTAIAILAILALCILPTRADELAQMGREVAAKYGDAVVTLQLVVKTQMSMEGEADEKEESKSEATAVVIDPSGLVVASLAATDPSEMMSRMMAGEDYGFKMTSEISELKIRLSDGTEIPAKVVLRDKDLDLAFIRPVNKPEKPLVAVDLAKQAKPALLDQVILLARLGTVASRSLAVTTDRVQSIVEKPRLFYVPGLNAMGSELGAPAFAADGSVIGILLLRTLPGRSPMGGGMMGMGSMGVLPVILPASDVVTAAKQAPEKAEGAAQ